MGSSNIHVEKDTRITVTMPVEHARKLVSILKPWYVNDREPKQAGTGKLSFTDLGHALEAHGVRALENYPFRIVDEEGLSPPSSSS